MKIVYLLAVLCGLALAQNPDLFEKAPPEVDEALRARIMIFYNAHISGKYRDAYQVVAQDAQDDYLAASKNTYSSCEVSKITYKENFAKAIVTTACKGEFRWRGNNLPITIPAVSTWKVEDGKWWWYHVHETSVVTPWGISKELPENMSGGAQPPPLIPADPMKAARDILKMVGIDSNAVQLKGDALSEAEVHISNGMPGTITVTVDPLPIKGTHLSVEPAVVPAGGKATVVISYDPNDPSIVCGSCTAKEVLPVLTANIRIQPTSQVFPVKVTFVYQPKK